MQKIDNGHVRMIIRHEKDPLSVRLTWMLSAKLNPSTGSLRQSSGASLWGGNWASKLLAVAVRRMGLQDKPRHLRVGFRLKGVPPFSYRMVVSRHRRHHRAQYQMSEPMDPLVLGKFSGSDYPSS
ncbi:hypothetical protein TNCV_2494471 [Trichonephila clavipes]|uniref:Uncharacterized protein n=1 Tax=Trichonephila clavipes TaxID=2585209 RepID=A0A8X6RPA5_TRICX|nr:hypothetical protein TNCV_2494471 [Trichonephila clavipes]